MLELKLLGSPQILLNGSSLPKFSAAKSQALLFYLVLSGRPQSRLALAELLWPDKREAEALANLRQAVYHLRNALPNYLEITRATLALNQALPCQIDAVLFEKGIGETNGLAVRQAARHVTQLYDQFLAPTGLRATQFSILSRLRRFGRLGINALAAELVMDRTTLGRTVKASAENPDVSRVQGINPKLVALAVWAIAGFLATLTMQPFAIV